jgi:hypothetical protein
VGQGMWASTERWRVQLIRAAWGVEGTEKHHTGGMAVGPPGGLRSKNSKVFETQGGYNDRFSMKNTQVTRLLAYVTGMVNPRTLAAERVLGR